MATPCLSRELKYWLKHLIESPFSQLVNHYPKCGVDKAGESLPISVNHNIDGLHDVLLRMNADRLFLAEINP